MNQILLGKKQDQSVISNKMRSRENVQGERKVRYRLSTLSKQEIFGNPFYEFKLGLKRWQKKLYHIFDKIVYGKFLEGKDIRTTLKNTIFYVI